MPNVSIDIKQLSGIDPGVDPSKASFDFWPYQPIHVTDGAENYLLNKNILRVKAPLGVADVEIPETPTGNAMWVQGRGYKGADKWLVAIPATDCNLWDLPHLDKETLDPEAPSSPAWVADLIAVQGELDATTEVATDADAKASTALTAAGEASATATTAQSAAQAADEKADTAIAGLAGKVNSSTYTAGLATKTDTSATGREALALVGNSRLTPWHAALANRNNKRANVVILGASLVEGAFVSTQSRTVAQALAAGLRAKFPTLGLTGGGRGHIGIPSPELTTSAQYVPGMWPMAFTGGLLDPPSNGAASAFDLGAKHQLWYSNTPGNKVVITLSAPITAFDIHHVKGPSGGASTLYYKVDGSAPVVGISTNSATAVHTVHRVNTPATSTIEIGVNGAGYLLFTGITEYAGDEDKGIHVHNLGHSGMKIAAWQDGYATAGSWRSAVASLNPDLLILQDLGINDGATPMTLAAIKTQLIAFIAVLRGGGMTCPIVLAANFNPKGGITLPWEWVDYVAMLREIETADTTVTVVDHSQRVPSTVGTDTYGLFSTIDHLHPRANGTANQWMADNYVTALTPR